MLDVLLIWDCIVIYPLLFPSNMETEFRSEILQNIRVCKVWGWQIHVKDDWVVTMIFQCKTKSKPRHSLNFQLSLGWPSIDQEVHVDWLSIESWLVENSESWFLRSSMLPTIKDNKNSIPCSTLSAFLNPLYFSRPWKGDRSCLPRPSSPYVWVCINPFYNLFFIDIFYYHLRTHTCLFLS